MAIDWDIDHVTSANGSCFTSALWLTVHSTHGAVLLLDLHPTDPLVISESKGEVSMAIPGT